jgi:hypothetical protein
MRKNSGTPKSKRPSRWPNQPPVESVVVATWVSTTMSAAIAR